MRRRLVGFWFAGSRVLVVVVDGRREPSLCVYITIDQPPQHQQDAKNGTTAHTQTSLGCSLKLRFTNTQLAQPYQLLQTPYSYACLQKVCGIPHTHTQPAEPHIWATLRQRRFISSVSRFALRLRPLGLDDVDFLGFHTQSNIHSYITRIVCARRDCAQRDIDAVPDTKYSHTRYIDIYRLRTYTVSLFLVYAFGLHIYRPVNSTLVYDNYWNMKGL